MSETVISFLEIKAWADLMQVTPLPFDVKTLREMSQAFISMREQAKKIDCKDPLKELKELQES